LDSTTYSELGSFCQICFPIHAFIVAQEVIEIPEILYSGCIFDSCIDTPVS